MLHVLLQDAPQVYGGSELVERIKTRTGVYLFEFVDEDDARAKQCPAGQRLLRVAGGRDQVGRQTRKLDTVNLFCCFVRWGRGRDRPTALLVACLPSRCSRCSRRKGGFVCDLWDCW